MPTTSEAVKILKRGGLVGYPTESFFALGADATNAKAVKLIYTVKGRDKKKPIALIASDFGQVQRFFRMTQVEKQIAKRYWPGSLTIVLRPKGQLAADALLGTPQSPLLRRQSPLKRGAMQGVGVRVPAHAGARRLARIVGRPLTATSLNFSGKPATKSRLKLMREFPGLSLQAGKCGRETKPSTVIEVVGSSINVVRLGAVNLKK